MRRAGSSRSPADGDEGVHRATPIEFEPTRLPPGRGGPFQPWILVVLALTFVGIALVKPWEAWNAAEPGTALASATPAASPPEGSKLPTAPPSPGRSSSPIRSLLSPVGVAATDWARVAAARSAHDTWGVAAFLESPDRNGGIRPVYASLEERWVPVRPEPDDGSAGGEPSVAVSVEGAPIRALGVTAPPGRTPLDVRIWSVVAGGPPVWLDIRPVDPSVAAGHLYLLPPRSADGWADRWSSGTYRVDLLLGSETVRFTLAIDSGSGGGLDAERTGPRPTAPPVPAPDVAWLEPGPFVVADGIGMRVSAALTPTLDETDTWLALGTDSAAPTVASVWLPAVEGIGFVLPGGAALEWAAFERVVPAPLSGVLASARSFRQEAGGVPTVVFSPSDGGAWAAGTYALDVRWVEAGERVAGRWHVTVLPGPGRRSAAWTVFARAWAPYAGTWGIVTGTADPRHGGPAASPASHRPQEPRPYVADASGPAGGCPTGVLPDPDRPVFGVSYPTDIALASVRLELADTVGRTVPIEAALNVVPGLAIVSPAAGERIDPGAYRLVLETASGASVLSVCYAELR